MTDEDADGGDTEDADGGDTEDADGAPEAPLDRYRAATATVVADALDEHGTGGVIGGIDPAHPDHVAVGRAIPVRMERVETDEHTNFPRALFEAFEPGGAFVVSSPTDRLSCWGALASRLADRAGMGGVVIDGGFRDVPEIREGAFGVFGADTTPRSGQKRLRVAAVGEPVEVDGVEVAAGDAIVGDATGIAVVPAAEAPAVAGTVGEILDKEAALDRKVADGYTAERLLAEYEGF
ncbi:MAG: RraA family protein [Haloarculaceae archaeon]